MMKSVTIAAALLLSALSLSAYDYHAAGDTQRQSAVVSSDSVRILDGASKKKKSLGTGCR